MGALTGGYSVTSVVENNAGFVTENSGSASVSLSSDTFVIDHGLSVTPTFASVVLGNTLQDDQFARVPTITSTQITGCIYDISSAARLSPGAHEIFWSARA